MAGLDDVLFDASPEIIRSVQQHILGLGGNLSDPAWVPVAAALRIKLETQSVIPIFVAKVSVEASQQAAAAFHDRVSQTAPEILSNLAQKAAETPLVEATRIKTWLAALSFGFLVFWAGFIFGNSQDNMPNWAENWLSNGNQVSWLECNQSSSKIIVHDGRKVCTNFQFWLTPSNPPSISAGLPAFVSDIAPLWMQRGIMIVITLGFGALIIYAIWGVVNPSAVWPEGYSVIARAGWLCVLAVAFYVMRWAALLVWPHL